MDCLLMTAPLRHGHDTCQRIQRVLGVTVTEHLRGVDLCLMMDQVGELITCPIHEGDGAVWYFRRPIPKDLKDFVNFGNRREFVISLKTDTTRIRRRRTTAYGLNQNACLNKRSSGRRRQVVKTFSPKASVKIGAQRTD